MLINYAARLYARVIVGINLTTPTIRLALLESICLYSIAGDKSLEDSEHTTISLNFPSTYGIRSLGCTIVSPATTSYVSSGRHWH